MESQISAKSQAMHWLILLCIHDSYNKFVNVPLHIFEFYICLDYISCILLLHEDILRIVKITYLDSLSIVPLINNHI